MLAQQMSGLIEDKDDFLEVSPNSIDYVFDWGLGGMKAVLNTADEGKRLYQEGYGNGIDFNKVMIVGRFTADLEDQEWRHSVNYYKMYNKGLRKRLSEDEKKQFKSLGQDLVRTDKMSQKSFNIQRKKVYNIQRDEYKNQIGIY